jgi:phage gp46-like protein
MKNVCAPPAPICRTTNYPVFNTPISARRIPECSPPPCPTECTGGNPAVRVTSFGTIDRSKWIEGWITSQLFTRGQVECDEHPLGKRDGGWWADSFRPRVGGGGNDFRSGSKLWALKWSYVTNDTLLTAKQYTLDALSYLIDWGIVATMDVTTLYVSHNVMHINVKITGPGVSRAFVFEGTAMPNSTWLWEEYRPGQATTKVPLSQRALVA